MTTVDVVVHSQTLAADRALLIELRAVDGAPLPRAEPGSHVDVHLGRVVRQYSLVDTQDAQRYLVCVQREENSRGGSRHVHESLRVGDTVTVSVPRSTFALDPSTQHAVLLAGGIGITPLLSMAAALQAQGVEFELHGYARGAMPLAEFVAAQPYAPRFTAHDTSVDASLRSGGPGWDVRPDTVIYACGPAGFLSAVTELALSAGLSADAVHSEKFLVEEPVDVSGDAFTVVAASTGERMAVQEGETIAEVLEEHGYEVVLSCEQGICGSCITGVLDGVPDHRDEVQSESEHASNALINVCVSRSLSTVLTLNV